MTPPSEGSARLAADADVWSDEVRVMASPFRAYEARSGAVYGAFRGGAASRAIFVLLVLGAFVSFVTAGRLVAFHVVATMIMWSPVVGLQLVALWAASRTLPQPVAFPVLVRLHFMGFGPWLLYLALLAGGCLFAPDVHRAFRALLTSGVLFASLGVVIAWSVLLTVALFRGALRLPRARAFAATGVYYLVYVGSIVGYYLATNQIQPQVVGP